MIAAAGLRSGLLFAAATIVFAPSCASTGAESEGDHDLPTAGVGPFRKLGLDEVPGIAPFVLDDRTALYREPAVLADGDATILYAVGTRQGADVIVRSRAADGRAFYGTSGDFGKTPPVVLRADQPWEGASVAGPFALRHAGAVYLYYAASGGIGVARSTDGLRFVKEASGPILVRDPTSVWETTQVHAPSVYLLPDGRLRMLYGSGAAIGEAESTDGMHFTRVDPDPSTLANEPVLGPSAPAAEGSLLPHEKGPFDTSRVDDPCAVVRITPAGRYHVRVLYTGVNGAGASAIGLAARYGETGPLMRQSAPVYSVSASEAAPALFELPDASYLYVQQDRRVTDRLTYSAIAGAFAPVAAKLPLPLAFPDAP